jgi:hypothetical protein
MAAMNRNPTGIANNSTPELDPAIEDTPVSEMIGLWIERKKRDLEYSTGLSGALPDVLRFDCFS